MLDLLNLSTARSNKTSFIFTIPHSQNMDPNPSKNNCLYDEELSQLRFSLSFTAVMTHHKKKKREKPYAIRNRHRFITSFSPAIAQLASLKSHTKITMIENQDLKQTQE